MLIQMRKNAHDYYKSSMKIILPFLLILVFSPISRCYAQSFESEITMEQDDSGKDELEITGIEETANPEEAVPESEEILTESKEVLMETQDKAKREQSRDDEYHYNPIGKRDPFYSKLLEEKKKIEPNKKLFGVQRYDLAELRLVGIIWGGLGRKGVVETPEGKSYLVKVGMPIGKNGGVVKAITNQEVVIQEFVTDYLGNEIENISIIKIQRKEQEQKQ